MDLDSIKSIKSAFFDTKEVTEALDPIVKKAMSKAGAFVRTRARSSLKYGTKSAAAGQVPIVHRSVGFTRKKKVKGQTVNVGASPLRELLFFSFDKESRSVVVGPAIGGPRTGAPGELESGDHPFMVPAMMAERATYADLFRGA
jgi:hypothetical protein